MGVKFTTGFTQGSGFADTTDNNTWDNMFMLYLSKRLEGYTHELAIEWLLQCVCVAGDDGLAAQLDVKCFGQACQLCGHSQKVKTMIDEPFHFLGRLYAPVSIAKSVRNSCQDPERIYVKFTCTYVPLFKEVDRRERLFLKACAVITTDPESPYISQVAHSVLAAAKREYDWEYKRVDTMMNYCVDGGTYSNHWAEWMQKAHQESQPTADWAKFEEYWHTDLTWEEIEEHPSFCELIEHDFKGCAKMTVELDHITKELVAVGDKTAVPPVHKDEQVDGDEYKECHDVALQRMRGHPRSATGEELTSQSSAVSGEKVTPTRPPKPGGTPGRSKPRPRQAVKSKSKPKLFVATSSGVTRE